MDDLKDKIEDFFSSIEINSALLLKIVAIIFFINISLFFYNITFNQIVYEKIKNKINDNKILIVDNNGNQYFKRIGYLNEQTVMEFAVISLKNILEISYNSSFNEQYAKRYATKKVYNNIKKIKKAAITQLTLDEGYYSIDIENIKFNKIDEKHKIWEIEAKIKKRYAGIGVSNSTVDEILKIKIIYKPNLVKNQLGLLVAVLNEKELTDKELKEYEDSIKDWKDTKEAEKEAKQKKEQER